MNKPSKKERKNWEQLEVFLKNKLGEEATIEIIQKARQNALNFMSVTKESSPSRLKTMKETILPRVAVYGILKENGLEADVFLDQYIREIVGPVMHNTYAKMEKIPFFYAIYSRMFVKFTDKSDAWMCDSKMGKNQFVLNIHKCLWHDVCSEYGLPEACRFFCECDNYTYGGLNKIQFTRTKTLGTGGELCDFCFSKKGKVDQKREREKKVVSLMIQLYCNKKHHTKKGLCEECRLLDEYARLRSEKCPFMESKTFCSNCKVHCYKPKMREKIREVMRFSGPRMIFYHPVMAIRHVIESRKEKKRVTGKI